MGLITTQNSFIILTPVHISFETFFSEYFSQYDEARMLFLQSLSLDNSSMLQAKIVDIVHMPNPSLLNCKALCYFTQRENCKMVVFDGAKCYIANFENSSTTLASFGSIANPQIYLKVGMYIFIVLYA